LGTAAAALAGAGTVLAGGDIVAIEDGVAGAKIAGVCAGVLPITNPIVRTILIKITGTRRRAASPSLAVTNLATGTVGAVLRGGAVIVGITDARLTLLSGWTWIGA